jgi:HEPN domain-containing protein
MRDRDSRDWSEWLRYAEEDLRSAESSLLAGTLLPRHLCFLAQQAVEKGLKAVLLSADIEPPQYHSLRALAAMVPGSLGVTTLSLDELDRLTRWAARGRYPSDAGDPDQAEAEAAVALAQTMLDVLHDILERDRPSP